MVYICTISNALGLKLTDIHNSSLFEQKGILLSHTRNLELGWIPGKSNQRLGGHTSSLRHC